MAIQPPPGGWSAYPPNDDIATFDLAIHSLVLKKHPFVDFDMLEGQLNLQTKEKNGEFRRLRNYYVTFLFNSKQKAAYAFDKLCKQYDSVSASKNIVRKADSEIAVFEDEKIKGSNQVEFIMTQDELFDARYKIIFGPVLDPMLTQHYGIQ